jgi:beta-glucuronidase
MCMKLHREFISANVLRRRVRWMIHHPNVNRFGIVALCVTLFCVPRAHAARSVSLNGPGWTFKTILEDAPTAVSVPHCWPAEERYRRYIGIALYERKFDAPVIVPGQIVRLHFDAVYDVTHVWLNGRMIGTHSGGYTPFEFDVTQLLRPGVNHLLLEVDNTPTLQSIPALATSNPTGSVNYPVAGTAAGEGIVGWIPYGGIVRPVSLLITDSVYLERMKVDAQPDLATGDANIHVKAWVHNASDRTAPVRIEGSVAGLDVVMSSKNVKANSDELIEWSGILQKAHLWSVRDPYLYGVRLSVPGDELNAEIGVRKIEVRGTQLLLNGHVVHLFGANRVSEDPLEGLRESDAIIQRDMTDMLADNMRMMRIAHYPQAPALLDFADEHGMLLIAEAGNWNMSGWQMADPTVRATWKAQMKEMMEQDWNHPSVIAWSVGNEYESFTQQGIDWTRDMRAFTLSLDPTRLITFASRFTADPAVKTGKDEASRYSDFVSVNLYGNYATRLDHVHALYPDKPVFVTEFGKMGEPGKHDPERIANIRDAVSAMKARPWVIGGSLWTWADYRSLHRGTPASGIRYWGVVNLDRKHRDSWQVVQKLFATDLP